MLYPLLPQGARWGPQGGARASRLGQGELLQAPLPKPVPGQVLPGHQSNHLREQSRVKWVASCCCGNWAPRPGGAPELGTWPVWSQALSPPQGLRASPRACREQGRQETPATHLVAVVYHHQMPEAQGPEQFEHPWEGRVLQRGQGLH